MELKPYQQQVINDIGLFLKVLMKSGDLNAAFHDFWTMHPRTPLFPQPGSTIEPYKNNVTGAAHICVKVPTAGGKTFIACNAIRTIFDEIHQESLKAVVWLVPSVTILEQTIKSLKDPNHPYRRKINSQFNSKVEVFDKATLLNATGFNLSSAREQLNIFVLSFDSLRAKNKDDRKVYQENSNLQSFAPVLDADDDISLMKVINALNPVVIVDESHNAESDLSVEMLKNLNPSFILDLTATPRKNSNIISFIDAIELKKENMVKLPVIYYNHQEKTDVIISALQLRKRLEELAKEEEKTTGRYIRPIILFQAQPKTSSETTTFQNIKEKLIALKIPESHIKIKTASINEIKGIDLMSRDCEVRYIITVNALKEGWDCPFAYILASLADKTSSVDVEQILGRVLRQPYVMSHQQPALNMSYVFTASVKFMDTMQSIVRGLNRAGFSDKEFRVGSITEELSEVTPTKIETPSDPQAEMDFDLIKISEAINLPEVTSVITIEKLVETENLRMETVLAEQAFSSIILPAELQSQVKTYKIKEVFKEHAAAVKLPRFYTKVEIGDVFNNPDILFSKEELLKGFQLSKADRNIDFGLTESNMYKIDLDPTKSDSTPTFAKVGGRLKDQMMEYILDPARKESRRKNFTARILDNIGSMYPIAENETKKYISNLLEDFTDEQYTVLSNFEHHYCNRIKEKIRILSEEHAEKKFNELLATNQLYVKADYPFASEICPGKTSKDIVGSLYEKEGEINGFEERVINEVANLDNVLFWTRNSKHQFKINGFINHYPDFIVYTKSGITVLIESKGDDRDNSDSEKKIRLGKSWESKAGSNFKYFMVFDKKEVAGASTLDNFLKLIHLL